jgi:SAM-dependent methyltransferase
MSADDLPGAGSILRLATAFYSSRVVMAAVELGVFTVVAAKPLDEDGLRARLGLAGRGVREFLDALVALGLLERREHGYGNSALAARYLDRGSAEYAGGFVSLADRKMYHVWARLTEALRTGKPQFSSRGEFFDGYADAATTRRFLAALDAANAPIAAELADEPAWPRVATALDVGGGRGTLVAALAGANPGLRGICFDLPPLRPYFEEQAAALGVGDRVAFVAGDFFSDPLPPADAAILGHVLHNWDVEARRRLLGSVARALPDGGMLFIYDPMLDGGASRISNLFSSLNMLLNTVSGAEYEVAECAGWVTEAGFEVLSTRPVGAGDVLLIARKNAH